MTVVSPAPEPDRAPASRFWQWIRHHTTSVVSTVIDYGVMVLAVETGALGPVWATVMGAFCGAITNFIANRHFTYRAHHIHVSRQAWRYALVSAASLGLNAGGEHLFHNFVGLQYLVARIITSVIVSNGWNYPMQRFFVFSSRSHPAS